MEFDFAESLETLDAVPQDFRGLYIANGEGEGFRLNTEGEGVGPAIAAVSRLNKALKASREDTRRAKEKAGTVDLTPLADYGTDVESILTGVQAALTEAREAGTGKSAEKVKEQLAALRKELETAHTAAMQVVTTRLDGRTAQLNRELSTNRLKAELQEQGAINADVVVPFLQQQIGTREADNGDLVSYVRDMSSGESDAVRFSSTTGKEFTIAELVTEFAGQEANKALFKSEKSPGTSTKPAHQVTRKTDTKVGGDRPQDKISRGLADKFGT